MQGVGFRPFVKKLADRMGIRGRVANTSSGVLIEIDAPAAGQFEAFLSALQSDAPPIAQIRSLKAEEVQARAEYASFEIAASDAETGLFTLISPDVATCPDCIREINDPGERRYVYAFTNCTNCGPRYSIICDVPYDRAKTTMASFRMCPACASEYRDPADRRFHAEPIACPACGPSLSESIDSALAALERGAIAAVKSLGGFQLACDAFSTDAVARLRSRKKRGNKPFAIMMRDLETVRRYCQVSSAEEELLAGNAAPIVLLRLRQDAPFPAGIAPGLAEIGVMLPYTPLHHLLLAGRLPCLVMSSGNISEEPIVISNEQALSKLDGIADEFVLHNRDIFMRVDDSVARYHGGRVRVLRRARGYAPSPLDLGAEAGEVLACGGELKNTFCLTKGRYAVVSQHIGDLDNWETLEFYEESLRNLKSVYRAEPRLIVHDLHPDYLTSRWAERQPEPKLAVQHHHAHIASCMAENEIRDPVIGAAFDGTGYGSDGQIWGGEFLICDYTRFRRAAHLRYVPLVGGDRSIREGYRMAAAHLFDALGPDYRTRGVPPRVAGLPPVFDQLLAQPHLMTSSCGRLFDAVASLTGICHINTYEGEAAMLLEQACSAGPVEPYRFAVETSGAIDTRPMIREIVLDLKAKMSPSSVANRFHETLAAIVEHVCVGLGQSSRLRKVCLSGGTFQNFTLLDRTVSRLEKRGFKVFTHSAVPPNDGGLALGQAVIGAKWLDSGKQ